MMNCSMLLEGVSWIWYLMTSEWNACMYIALGLVFVLLFSSRSKVRQERPLIDARS